MGRVKRSVSGGSIFRGVTYSFAPHLWLGAGCFCVFLVFFSCTVCLFFGVECCFFVGVGGVWGVFVYDVRTIMFIKTH